MNRIFLGIVIAILLGFKLRHEAMRVAILDNDAIDINLTHYLPFKPAMRKDIPVVLPHYCPFHQQKT